MRGVASAMVDAGWHTSLFDIRDKEGKSSLTSKVWAEALADEDPLATELFGTAIGKGFGCHAQQSKTFFFTVPNFSRIVIISASA